MKNTRHDHYDPSNAFDRTVFSLCEEIDDLRQQVAYWKTKYEDEVQERIAESNARHESVMTDLGNTLMFALSIKDDENGNLVISKEDRAELAAAWNKP